MGPFAVLLGRSADREIQKHHPCVDVNAINFQLRKRRVYPIETSSRLIGIKTAIQITSKAEHRARGSGIDGRQFVMKLTRDS